VNTKLMVAAIVAAGVLCGSARAEGFYVSGQGGLTFLQDADNTAAGGTIETSFDTGWALGGSVGYAFANGIRAEAELGYRQNDLDQARIGGLGSADMDGDVSALSFMANGWYDIKTGTPFTPYLGGGIGFAQVSVNDAKIAGVALADDDDTVFAYQVGAGVAFAVAPKINLTLDYRFFGTADPSFKAAGGGSFDSEYHSHNIMAGMRFEF
jgi:opacity protein-like surface antigen